MSETKKEIKKITTPVGRLSFPSLFKAESFGEGDPKYSCTLLFPKGSTDLTALQNLAKEVAQKSYPNGIPANFRTPFRDGDKDKPNTDGYAGMIFITFKSNSKPKVVDLAMQEILDPDVVYAGCYVRVSCNAFCYDNKGNKGVSFGLSNVQKVKDGDSFGGRSNPADDFADSAQVAAQYQPFDHGANSADPFAL